MVVLRASAGGSCRYVDANTGHFVLVILCCLLVLILQLLAVSPPSLSLLLVSVGWVPTVKNDWEGHFLHYCSAGLLRLPACTGVLQVK